MSDINKRQGTELTGQIPAAAKNLEQVANELCEKALNDAKAQLHPLLRSVELDRLDRRFEFVQAFKFALERRIAKKMVATQPGVQAIFRFDELWRENCKSWDGSIHLLVKVPRLSSAVKSFGKRLDRNLLKCLKGLGWSRFQTRQSILEIQQVTPNELRHGIGYGAMFYAVYSAPVKVWPQQRLRDGKTHM